MSTVKRIMTELSRLTPKEREFILTFFGCKTGQKPIDQRNFMFSIETEGYRNETRMKGMFEGLYSLTEEEIKKLQKMYRV